MPADFASLTAKITELTTQVESTESIEASAVALINGFAVQVTAAVAAALTADNAADQGSIDATNAAIEGVRARFAASGAALGAAVVANTPGAPPPDPTTVP